MTPMLYVWIAVLVAAVVLEAVSSELVAIWFFPAAIVALILELIPAKVAPWVQILVFLAVGLILVVATRPLCRRFLKKGQETKTNAESLVGRECVVTEEIRNVDEVGEVRVGGLCWTARSERDDEVIAAGEHVIVTEIQGVKLIVKPKGE